MRKGIRFTPGRLAKWQAQGRGTGTREDYAPWHQVTRSDPASRGRSHLIVNIRFGRLHHFLSDLEMVAFGLAMMLPGIVEVREQFPLSFDRTPVAHGGLIEVGDGCDGTLAIAGELGVRHPRLNGAGESAPWVMTTDLVVDVCGEGEAPERIAVSVKPVDGAGSPRSRELLEIEREYWRRRRVDWLLVTPAEYGSGVGNAVRAALPWVVSTAPFRAEQMARCAALRERIVGRSIGHAVSVICSALQVESTAAQALLWQSVWTGAFPMDLSRPLRPSEPLRFLSEQAFWQQNPIAARRSAWAL